jgi:hypothetical protein
MLACNRPCGEPVQVRVPAQGVNSWTLQECYTHVIQAERREAEGCANAQLNRQDSLEVASINKKVWSNFG